MAREVIAASRQTLVANIIQQFCAAAIILLLPNLLSKPDYAQVVYVGVLLSFAAFADAGFSLAYGRVAPTLHARGDHGALAQWNATVLRFGLLTAALFALVIAGLYYVRHAQLLYAALLLPVPFLVFWFSFYVSRASVTGEFREYRKTITWRALASLLVIPLSFAAGLAGWFVGTLMAALVALLRVGKRLRESVAPLHWPLVRAHWKEGLQLAAISVLWLQLLNAARLYASLRYAPEDLATYGILTSAYQSVSTLMISVFLPVSVGMLGRYGASEGSAIDFGHRMLQRSLPWTILITLVGIFAAPYVLHACFPNYQFDTETIAPLFLSMLFYPFFIVWGNLLVAQKRTGRYLMLIALGLGVAAISGRLVDAMLPTTGAAFGQWIGLMVYSLLLACVVSASIRRHGIAIWRVQIVYLLGVSMLCATVMRFVA